MLQRTLGEDIAVKTVARRGPVARACRSSQLEDAILNLAVNARDAMPKGGQLVIETANVHLDADYAAEHVEVTPGDYVAVIVTDSGSGMAPGGRRARLRSIFHHQGRGTRHRPRAEHGLRLREAVARPCEDLQRGRARHEHQALPAASRSAEARDGGAAARPRVHPAAARPSWSSRMRGRAHDGGEYAGEPRL